jgi:2,3-bisphosphoglycerate-independent phosphoglycerate mutase
MQNLAAWLITVATNTDLTSKLHSALKAAEEFSFALLHINGADEVSLRMR